MSTDVFADLEAERAIVSALLIDHRTIATVGDLDPLDMYDVRHQIILRCARELFEAGEPIDPVSVRGQAERSGSPLDIRFLMGAMDAAGSSLSAPHYARQVIMWARLRAANTRAHRAQVAMRRGDTEGALGLFREIGGDCTGIDARNPVVSFGESAAIVLETIARERADPDSRRGVGMRTGLQFIDSNRYGMLGLHRKHLLILAARPSVGKSVMALQVAFSVAEHEGPALFWSSEMSHEELTQRLLSHLSGVRYSAVKTGDMTDAEMGELQRAYARYEAAPLHIWDKGSVTVTDIRSQAQALGHRYGKPTALVCVDYIQNMSCDRRFRDPRHEVEHNSRALKMMASDDDVCVLAVAQLSRALESRADKHPIMSDLRESGKLEQDANEIVMLYRPHVHDPNEDPSVAEACIVKVRGGKPGRASLDFDGSRQTFADAAPTNDWQH